MKNVALIVAVMGLSALVGCNSTTKSSSGSAGAVKSCATTCSEGEKASCRISEKECAKKTSNSCCSEGQKKTN